ncbi:hypothetical protein F4677DRAFT_437494 [Hypoxylon crocopeplum]|nr:hypothetical protein F4677DRAFT_437494 [Hypoxylon crocopeplum]
MTSIRSKALRAVAAVPFLYLTVWCLRTMDIAKIVAHQQPFAESGVIEWEGGRVSIINHFHHVDLLDQIWRGTTATFAPSTLGFDNVASWQMFSFLTDLGPVYAVWIMESYRPANARTPAYLPTLFALTAQFSGIGIVAPFFYFLSFVFGPSGADLAHGSPKTRTAWQVGSVPLLPLVLLLNTFEVFAMFLSPEHAARHFWTWAWQLTPFWIGFGNVLLTRVVGGLSRARNSLFASPKLLLAILGLASSGVWIYTILYSPYPLATLFIPQAGSQSEYVLHARKALQADELSVFAASFLWLVYSLFDLHSAGIVGNEWLFYVGSLPVVTACVGPGAAFLLGWYWRETALFNAKRN